MSFNDKYKIILPLYRTFPFRENFHKDFIMSSALLASYVLAYPSPERKTGRGNVCEKLTQIAFRDVTPLARKWIMVSHRSLTLVNSFFQGRVTAIRRLLHCLASGSFPCFWCNLSFLEEKMKMAWQGHSKRVCTARQVAAPLIKALLSWRNFFLYRQLESIYTYSSKHNTFSLFSTTCIDHLHIPRFPTLKNWVFQKLSKISKFLIL